ncbi:unnamed protein product, partial [Mesorhabditis spiculigera]
MGCRPACLDLQSSNDPFGLLSSNFGTAEDYRQIMKGIRYFCAQWPTRAFRWSKENNWNKEADLGFYELLEHRSLLEDGVLHTFLARSLSPAGFANISRRFESDWFGRIRPLDPVENQSAVTRIRNTYDGYFPRKNLQAQKRYFYAEKYFRIDHPRGGVTVMLRARGALVFQELRFDERMAREKLSPKTCPKEFRVRVHPVWAFMFDAE